MRFLCFLLGLAGPAFADPFAVHDAATSMFDRLPAVEVAQIDAVCGTGRNSNPRIGYCTSDNTIYIAPDFAARPQAGYEMAHVLGHAVQVRHGVADVALREISRRPDEEEALRGMVTRQVECIAGVLMARAGLAPLDLAQAFGGEPFTGAHWGRRPLNGGPRVSIGVEGRQDWLDIGHGAGDVAVCAVGEMSSDLLVEAVRGTP